MTDQKLTALTEDTTPAATDYAYTVKDPSTTPLSRRATWLNIVKGALSGVWTPASSTGPGSFVFGEDTDNGTSKVTLSAPSALAADRAIAFPDAAGTLALIAQTVTNGNTTTAPSEDAVYDAIAALGAYTTYTPTFSQSASLSTSALTARYNQTGKMVHAFGTATFSSAGTTNNAILVSLPVTATSAFNTNLNVTLGTGNVEDSGTLWMPALCMSGSTTSFGFTKTNGDAQSYIGQTPNFAIALGDKCSWNIRYEAA